MNDIINDKMNDKKTLNYEHICGLHNLGNTCYMNSVIQILIHNPILEHYFRDNTYTNDLPNGIINRMTSEKKPINNVNDIEAEIQASITFNLVNLCDVMSTGTCVAPQRFKYSLGVKNQTFAGNGQNDSHELLTYLLDAIHEETKYSINIRTLPIEYTKIENMKNGYSKILQSTSDQKKITQILREYMTYLVQHKNEALIHSSTTVWKNYIEKNSSIISHFFTGLHHSTIKCLTCSCESHNFEHYTSISLELIPEKSSMTLFECLDNFIKCEPLEGTNAYHCSECDTKRACTKKITFWNIPNMFIINLKRFKHDGHTQIKLNNNVVYPTILDMKQYTESQFQQKTTYDLIGVVHHYGGTSGGHYVSFAKIQEHWYAFNDERVGRISNEDFLKRVMTNDSYILVYALK